MFCGLSKELCSAECGEVMLKQECVDDQVTSDVYGRVGRSWPI